MKLKSKKAVALFVSMVLVVGAVATLSILFLFGGSSVANYDKLIIDVAKYQSIGVAARPKAMPKNTVSAASSSTTNRLVGVTLDGEVEELVFKDIKNNKDVKQSLNVASINFFERLTFVVFIDEEEQQCSVNYSSIWATDDYHLYCIDNNTGKIYSLNKTLRKNAGENYVFIKFGEHIWNSPNSNVAEHDGSVYFSLQNYSSSDYNIMKASVTQNGELEIKQLTNNNASFQLHLKFLDKYGNIFTAMSSGGEAYRMIKTSGELETLTEGAVLGMDKRAYNWEGTKYYDANGELQWVNEQDHDEAMDLTWLSAHHYITTVDGWDYYDTGHEYHYRKIGTYTYSSYTAKFNLFKIKYEVDNSFIIEEVTDFNVSSCVAAGSKLYFLASNKLMCYDIATDTQSEITDYIFTTIKSNNLGEVLFTARDSFQNIVNGIIRSNGDIEVNVKKATFEVFYLQPLN